MMLEKKYTSQYLLLPASTFYVLLPITSCAQLSWENLISHNTTHSLALAARASNVSAEGLKIIYVV